MNNMQASVSSHIMNIPTNGKLFRKINNNRFISKNVDAARK